MRRTLKRGALALVAALGFGACKSADTGELEADTKELRSELREVREDLRDLRGQTRELRQRLDALDQKGGAAQPGSEPTGDAGVPPGERLPPLPDGGAPPPTQSNVKISIRSNPSGATVFQDDRKLGRTPLLYQTPPGVKELMLRIEKPGYRPRLLSIRPDEDAKISVQLAKQ